MTAPAGESGGKSGSTVVISPHFDDAVLSCGHFLEHNPGTTVVTVCSGLPGRGVPADPEWDALAGFTSADEAAAARRAEDLSALTVLGAEQRVLGYLDGSYKAAVGRPHADLDVVGSFEEELTRSISGVLDGVRPETCLVPLGILHDDHVTTRKAAIAALRHRPAIRVRFYLDLPYGLAFGPVAGELADQLAVEPAGHPDRPRTTPGPPSPKVRALACYRSQLPLLEVAFGDSLRASFDSGAERLFRFRD